LNELTETVTAGPNAPAKPKLETAPALWQGKEIKRFARFFVVGLIGAVIDNGTFNGLNALGWFSAVKLALPLGFTLTGLGLAGTLGFALAVTSNFIWNRHWVYPDSRSKPIASQAVTFFVVNIVGILIRIPILELLSAPFGAIEHVVVPQLNGAMIGKLGENSAWALAVIVVMFWNFFVNRYWTYNDVT